MTFPSFKTIDTKIDRQSRIQFGRVHFGVFSTSCLAPHLGLDVVVHMWVQFWRVLSGLHKLWYPGIRDRSTWGKFGVHGEHGDVFLFSNLGAL